LTPLFDPFIAAMSEDSFERARILAESGDTQGAVHVLGRYLEAAPGDVSAHFQLAHLLLHLGDAPGAVQSFQRAIALEPENALMHSDLGTALEEAGRELEAAEAYEYAARANPPFPPAQHNLALVLCRQGRWDEAVQLLRTAIEQTPDFRAARLQLGVALGALGQEDAARACFDELLARDGRDVGAHHAIADMHMSNCRFAEAAQQLETCLALAPEDAQTILSLGACLQELDRVDEALAHYRRLLSREPSRYYQVVKKLTSASRGRFWVKSAELRRILLG
jgi:tetratricopeptide (TPR) repeat protein